MPPNTTLSSQCPGSYASCPRRARSGQRVLAECIRSASGCSDSRVAGSMSIGSSLFTNGLCLRGGDFAGSPPGASQRDNLLVPWRDGRAVRGSPALSYQGDPELNVTRHEDWASRPGLDSG
jgi:hypothetical protein